jgi:hypothetical protein
MSENFLPIAGVLMALVGVACGAGGKILWGGKPDNWPDVIADDALLRKVAIGLIVVSAALLVTGVGAALRQSWAITSGMIALALFVIGGFLGNYKVFGDIRPTHTITNTVIAALILWLLWKGGQ